MKVLCKTGWCRGIAAVLLMFLSAAQADEQGSGKAKSPPGYSLEFSGADYVLIPELQYDGSQPITVEAIVTPMPPDPNSVRSAVVANIQLSGVGIHFSRGRWIFHVNEGRGSNGGYASAYSDADADLNKTVHLAGVYDGTAVRLFVDGRLQDAEDKTTRKHVQSPHQFMVGADPNGKGKPHQYFKGTIDEVRISSAARYTKDFTPMQKFEPDDDTLILYHFDEGEGKTAKDASKNEYDGEIYGAKWVKEKRPGN